MTEQPVGAARIRTFGASVFTEMTELANRTGAINLGQGFPDSDGPERLLRYAREAIDAGHNQYAPAGGIAALRGAIRDHQSARYGLDHDPDTEVVVTTGATEAIAAAVLGLCDPGDEVLTFEPCYDSYPAVVAFAGGVLRGVPLEPGEQGFAFDVDRFAAAIGPRTRLLLLNSPHNPTGKVFGRAELAAIAELCVRHDLLVVTDEVYEHLVYDGEHVPIATLPGMRERTLTISSAGKTFSVTGWKIGWACGPAALVRAVRLTKQFLTFASGTPFQVAVARMLDEHAAWSDGLRADLQQRRDLLRAGLEKAGLRPLPAEGTYFVQADIRPWGYDDATAFCRELPHRAGVVAVPSSAFYLSPGAPGWLVRFAFCKRTEVLEEAVRRLLAAA